MATDPDRLRAFLANPDVPEEAKRQAARLYQDEQGATTTTATTPAEGFLTAAAEAGGATAAELFGAPPGLGAALAGGAADFASRRPFSEQRAERRVIQGESGKVFQKVLGAGAKVGGEAIASRFPSFAEFMGKVGSTVGAKARDYGGRALKATGDLGKSSAEAVAKRFSEWSDAAFEHLNKLAGPEPIVPTGNIQAAAEGMKTVPGFSKEEQAAFKTVMSSDKVPFSVARQVVSGFKRLTRTSLGQKELADPMVHQWRTLADAAEGDIDQFLERGPDFTGPQNPELTPLRDELTQTLKTYREGREAMQATYLYRRALSADGSRFDPAKFSTLVKNLDDKGILSRTVGADRAPMVRELAAKFAPQPSSMAGGVAKNVGKGLAIGTGLALPYAAVEHPEYAAAHPDLASILGGGALALGALTPTGRRVVGAMAPQALTAAAAHNPAVQRFLDPDILINALGGQGQTP